MRRALASWLNDRGLAAADRGNRLGACREYHRAARVDPSWSVPWYNLGLDAKYLGDWPASLQFNQKAVEHAPHDEGAWWNLGIAATALRNWAEARKAWRHVGVAVPDGDGEWTGPPVTACVRINPGGDGEVVWGERIDPARLVILNIPLPESGHRFNDIVLNDGAQNGTRTKDGQEFPVFDELEVWQGSRFATYQVNLTLPYPEAQSALIDLCNERGLGIEDWSSIRWICAECSRGNPGPHDCSNDPANPRRMYAMAAETISEIHQVLNGWQQENPGTRYGDIELLVPSAR